MPSRRTKRSYDFLAPAGSRPAVSGRAASFMGFGEAETWRHVLCESALPILGSSGRTGSHGYSSSGRGDTMDVLKVIAKLLGLQQR